MGCKRPDGHDEMVGVEMFLNQLYRRYMQLGQGVTESAVHLKSYFFFDAFSSPVFMYFSYREAHGFNQ